MSAKEKHLELDRLVFFCDAVTAIALTLLALELRVEKPRGEHLLFKDIAHEWPVFLAFFLSFLTIAIFWKVHHKFFSHIRKVDTRLTWYNIGWLFFIVLLPFSTTLVSSHLYDTPAIFVYSMNVFAMTIFQNLIWDYVSVKKDFMKEEVSNDFIYYSRLSCNVAMVNAVIAVGLSFISPLAAFIILFFRLPMMWIAKKLFKAKFVE